MVKILRTSLPVFRMLEVEEALFRVNKNSSYIIFNHFKSQNPAVVCGLGQKKIIKSLINFDNISKQNLSIPIIKRFTGGGTVLTDSDTFFISFIMNSKQSQALKLPLSSNGKEFNELKIEPREIMRWSEAFYKQFFQNPQLQLTEISSNFKFRLEDTDYVFGNRKFGGNAQAISGERFVHHTSFLFKFNTKLMKTILLNPKKQPKYRDYREHNEFLISLSEVFPKITNIETFYNVLKETSNEMFQEDVEEIKLENLGDLESLIKKNQRRKNELLNINLI